MTVRSVICIRDVEDHGAVIGVDRYLHGVPDVIETVSSADALSIGKALLAVYASYIQKRSPFLI